MQVYSNDSMASGLSRGYSYTINGLGQQGDYIQYMNPNIYENSNPRNLYGLGQGEAPSMRQAILGGVVGVAVGGILGGLMFSLATRILPLKTTTK